MLFRSPQILAVAGNECQEFAQMKPAVRVGDSNRGAAPGFQGRVRIRMKEPLPRLAQGGRAEEGFRGDVARKKGRARGRARPGVGSCRVRGGRSLAVLHPQSVA